MPVFLVKLVKTIHCQRKGVNNMAQIKDKLMKYYARDDKSVTLMAASGHFATSNSHINYFIDITRMKIRISEAKEASKALRQKLEYNVIQVDTICCLEGTEVLGGFLGEELEKGQFQTANLHETMYVIHPEENNIRQFMFRANTRLCIENKDVLILVPSITTGATIQRMVECIEDYGGRVAGVAAIFSTMTEVEGTRVFTLFTDEDLPGYHATKPKDCPLCRAGLPIEAMVNGFGYSPFKIG